MRLRDIKYMYIGFKHQRENKHKSDKSNVLRTTRFWYAQSQKSREPNKNTLHFVFDDKVVMSTLYFIQHT